MYQPLALARTRAASSYNIGTALLQEAEEEWTPKKVSAFRSRAAKLAIQEKERWGNGTLKEWTSTGRKILRRYYKEARLPIPNNFPTGAWSATFISWLMRRAGAGRWFRYSRGHSVYFRAARKNRLSNNDNPFKAFRVTEIKPQVGDLICGTRGSKPVKGYDTPRKDFFSHCDLVVRILPDRALAIGGNVSNSVKQKSVPLDERGFVKRFYTDRKGQRQNRFTIIRAIPTASGRSVTPLPIPTPGRPPVSSFSRLVRMVSRLVRRGKAVIAVRLAIARGIRNENKLTNLIFFARHPELKGRKIRRGERELAREWLAIRDRLILPILRPRGGRPSKAIVTKPTSGLTRRINRSTTSSDKTVLESPQQLLAQARAVAGPNVTMDELVGARLAASEHASGSQEEIAAIIDTMVNRAHRKGRSLLQLVTSNGTFGKQGGRHQGGKRRPASTRRDPSMRHLLLAREVVTTRRLLGISCGAMNFFDPKAQFGQHRKWIRGEKPKRTCHPLTILESWTHNYQQSPKGSCVLNRKRRSRGLREWVGPIAGINPLRLMLLRPTKPGREHKAQFAAACSLIASSFPKLK